MATVGAHALCEPSRPFLPKADTGFAQPLEFRSIDTHAHARSPYEALLLAQLLFASRGLAHFHVKTSRGCGPSELPLTYCDECQHAALGGVLTHGKSCRVGNVLGILEAICASSSTDNLLPQRRKEDAPAGESVRAEGGNLSCAEFGEPWRVPAEFYNVPKIENCEGYSIARMFGATVEAQEHALRVQACVNFCVGIPTERLQRELPLASAERRRWHEIQHLRTALPWLPVLATEADDSAVLL